MKLRDCKTCGTGDHLNVYSQAKSGSIVWQIGCEQCKVRTEERFCQWNAEEQWNELYGQGEARSFVERFQDELRGLQ